MFLLQMNVIHTKQIEVSRCGFWSRATISTTTVSDDNNVMALLGFR
ncbi:hypothetical protein HanRHA438_Chr16g0765951 [Helianthus annuus]|uniref:Uncharacterized protein n=1 Tax=Helianthus annuus TaxID=4232 RepID=A0A9K3GYI1_HELAN|nr:hypothetical protein HanXRQr2_Chr16g0753981 [Helianthus annuus]KAJ0443299.1 hypothetical protein HanIR_Chr16g0819231 [Helianthus annuus]KAJ0460851.1 hypothetical protein HanHA89_Chr16g0665641 [Helianthus annuus]KAJ0641270.1 hypothetical protein HanLR1_Chr16g0625301 [Helianthus annuus]KAJ0821647.1 hypothetical protein HanPSC8_Chr16g0722691 [Helianthus annuus]